MMFITGFVNTKIIFFIFTLGEFNIIYSLHYQFDACLKFYKIKGSFQIYLYFVESPGMFVTIYFDLFSFLYMVE